MSHLGTEPSPLVLQNPSVNPVPFTGEVNPGNSQEQAQIRRDDGITSDVSSGRYFNVLSQIQSLWKSVVFYSKLL